MESSNRVVNRLDRTYTTMNALCLSALAAIIKQLVLEHNPAVSVIVRTCVCVLSAVYLSPSVFRCVAASVKKSMPKKDGWV